MASFLRLQFLGFAKTRLLITASPAAQMKTNNRSFCSDGAAEEKVDVDFYKVLGLPKSADAKRIKQAYLKKAALWHPDRNSHTPELAKRKFEEVAEAMAVLSDDDTRRLYDNGQYKRGSHVKKQPPRAGY